MYLDYEKNLNMRLDNIDQLVSDMIIEINENSDLIKATLLEASDNVGYTLTTEMQDIWSHANDVLHYYGQEISGALRDYLAGIDQYMRDMKDAIRDLGDQLAAQAQSANDVIDADTTPSSGGGGSGMTRMFNPKTGEHLLTDDKNEIKTLKKKGWTAEDTGNNPTYSADSSNGNTELVRIFKPGQKAGDVGDHMWVVKGGNEYNTLTKKYGWVVDEQDSMYAYDSKQPGTTKMYRLFDTKTGTHLETTDKNEVNTLMKMEPDRWKLDDTSLYVKKYARGVHKLKDDELAWTQEYGTEAILRPTDGAILTPLKAGDSVVTAAGTENLFKFANDPYSFIKAMNLGTNSDKIVSVKAGNSVGEVNNSISISLPNVQDYNSFVKELQSDRQFEKMIQDMTINRVFGGSSLKKYSNY